MNELIKFPLDKTNSYIKRDEIFKNAVEALYSCRKFNYLNIPYNNNDITIGEETEMQTAVIGDADKVDLPLYIINSTYFKNIIKRAASQDINTNISKEIESYIKNNESRIWENSWVRFPEKVLGTYARDIFDNDLLKNKGKPKEGYRDDWKSFFLEYNNEAFVRIPISYLLKLSLADFIAENLDDCQLNDFTKSILNNFSNDNTSPEICSFYVVTMKTDNSYGASIAKESALRNLLVQLITIYANKKFLLEKYGQQVVIYRSALPPLRQNRLNNCISDEFYRELFMSPCLSGWDIGEYKMKYMGLCHQILSRSKLNTLSKLKAAGIVNNNLVVLPNTSSTSLANNGVHISIGSKSVSHIMQEANSGFSNEHEKVLGDLVTKVVEHFLPLFPGIYSASPHRISFEDFHPESLLGFLPHEIDFTHLRMIWRRWRKKSKNNFFSKSFTPFGPKSLDRSLAKLLRLKGDYAPDYRLVDYFVSLMSTDDSPALDGTLHNGEKLKNDLTKMGIFDNDMSFYSLYRMREFNKIGYAGFEGRFFSIFESLKNDMANAVDLQILITALAYKYVLNGTITHYDIPDNVFCESERRQIFFANAIGIPTFFIREGTENKLIRRILTVTDKLRESRRYKEYTRVKSDNYLKALIKTLELDAPDIIEAFGFEKLIIDLKERINNRHVNSVHAKMVTKITKKNVEKVLDIEAENFNSKSEEYLRNDLRLQYIEEGLEYVNDGLKEIGSNIKSELNNTIIDKNQILKQIKDNSLSLEETIEIMKITLSAIYSESCKHNNKNNTTLEQKNDSSSIR